MSGVDLSIYPKADPNAFTNAAGNFLGLANDAVTYQQKHQDLVKGQVDTLSNVFSSLASKGDISQDDFVSAGQRLLSEGVISPETYQTEIMAVAKAGSDPTALRNLATNYSLRALDAGQRFSQQYGTPGVVNTGDFQQPILQSGLIGTVAGGQPIQNTLTPQDITQPAVVNGPNGLVNSTKGQALENQGISSVTGRPRNNGLVTSVQVPPNSPAPNGPTVAAPAPALPGPVPVGGPEAAVASGTIAGQDLGTDRSAASNYVTAVTPLQEAIKHIDALGPNATGPGAEDINTIQSFAQAMGFPIVDPEKVRNFDEFKKYVVNVGRTSNGNTSTNDQLASAIAGSPGTTVSTLANKDVLRVMLGNARLQNAKVRLFDSTGQPENTYGTYGAQFNANQDPRAYVFDLMPVADRKKLIDGLKPDEKAKFVTSLRTAVQLGLISPPNG